MTFREHNIAFERWSRSKEMPLEQCIAINIFKNIKVSKDSIFISKIVGLKMFNPQS